MDTITITFGDQGENHVGEDKECIHIEACSWFREVYEVTPFYFITHQ